MMMSKRKVAEAGGSKERWLLTYADLITLLVCFFIMMYSFAQTDLEKFKSLSLSMQQAFGGGSVIQEGGKPVSLAIPGEGGTETMGIPGEGGAETVKLDKAALYNKMDQQIEEVAAEMGLGDSVSVQRTDEGILVRIEGNVAFTSSKADLRPEALAILDEVAKTVATTPNEIRVGGHTDNVPICTEQFPSNWELSTARAVAVARYLVEHGQVAPERVYAAGYGEYRPIASNDTIEQRAHNRRAEILIIYPDASALNAEPESAPKGH